VFGMRTGSHLRTSALPAKRLVCMSDCEKAEATAVARIMQ
jgi:hypothetical protein